MYRGKGALSRFFSPISRDFPLRSAIRLKVRSCREMDLDELKRFPFLVRNTGHRSFVERGRKSDIPGETFLSNDADTRNFSDNGTYGRASLASRCCLRAASGAAGGATTSVSSVFSSILLLSLYVHSAGELDEKFYERDNAAVNAARRGSGVSSFTSAAVYIAASFFSPAASSSCPILHISLRSCARFSGY